MVTRRGVVAGLGLGALGLGALGLAGLALTAGTAMAFNAPRLPPLLDGDYAEARRGFHTRLTRHGPAPERSLPLTAPSGAETIGYRSGALELTAWIGGRPAGGPRRPAVLFLHGGNALSHGHWDLARPYVARGFVAMMPAVRAENGQPGAFSGFYDETEDVVAAAETLAALPEVDTGRVFLAGHSVGGTLTLLAAMASRRFRAATAFSGNPSAFAFFERFPEDIRFDASDPREFEMRSAICYATSFKCPIRLFHGSGEGRLEEPSRVTVARGRAAGLDIATAAVAGDHVSALGGEIERSIAFFEAA